MMSPSLNSVSLSRRAIRPFTGNLKHFRQTVIGIIPASVFMSARLKVAAMFATESSIRPPVLQTKSDGDASRNYCEPKPLQSS